MSTLFWPGERAAATFTDSALLTAMMRVETAWLDTLVGAGIAPRGAALFRLLRDGDTDTLAYAAEAGGNPVIPFVAVMRERLRGVGQDDAASWLHRGLTSQDVLDSAMMLMARDARGVVALELREAVDRLVDLAERHRTTPMIGRTLTQHAVPITFGAKVASWLQGILDALDDLDRLVFPVQCGGAAGTLSGSTVLTGGDDRAAIGLGTSFARALDLAERVPWHTDRAPVTRIGEAFTRVTAAAGRVANDVLTLSRPEIGELAESDGGGSSTMPQKQNPVRSVFLRRAALTAPAQLSLLHLAAADSGDERPAGAWHTEWLPLQVLGRLTLNAGLQTTALVTGLRVDEARMAANLDGAVGVDAEQQELERLGGPLPEGRLAGAAAALVDAAVERAQEKLGGHT